MANILVLGGSGFVSEALSKYLIRRGYSIDILTRGKKKISFDGYENHILCDRHDKAAMKEALKDKKYSYVFDISGYTKNDIEILFNALVDLKSLEKYVFCSSASVYGDHHDLVTEESPVDRNSIWGDYSLNKIECEEFIMAKVKEGDLKATIFRPTYIYGEGNTLKRESYFFDKIINDEVIQIPDEDTKVQFIHIEDLVKNFECAMYNKFDGRIYNLTHPVRYTFEELVMACAEAVGKDAIINKVPREEIEFFPFRKFNFNVSIMDMRENGFHSPMVTLNEGLNFAYNWYKSNKKNAA